MALSTEDKKWLRAAIHAEAMTVYNGVSRSYGDGDPNNPRPYANKHLAERLDHVSAQLAQLGTVGVDVAKLAAAIESKLGPQVAKDVVALLAHDLGNG